jgi:hypothetical protein
LATEVRREYHHRCLKRYLARELYGCLNTAMAA